MAGLFLGHHRSMELMCVSLPHACCHSLSCLDTQLCSSTPRESRSGVLTASQNEPDWETESLIPTQTQAIAPEGAISQAISRQDRPGGEAWAAERHLRVASSPSIHGDRFLPQTPTNVAGRGGESVGGVCSPCSPPHQRLPSAVTVAFWGDAVKHRQRGLLAKFPVRLPPPAPVCSPQQGDAFT